MGLIKSYLKVPLGRKLLAAFFLGIVVGGIFWWYGSATGNPVMEDVALYLTPFGSILLNMLKMVVLPVVFFSLIYGAASLPLNKLGRVGGKVIGWYLITSLLAACIGLVVALIVRPGAGTTIEWQKLIEAFGSQVTEIAQTSASSGDIVSVLTGMFNNPFESLATMNFLPMIVFAILFGIAISMISEKSKGVHQIIDISRTIVDVMFKIIDWILQYAPIGVFALTVVNFGLYGPDIVGPYVRVIAGVVGSILVMIFLVYSLLNYIFTRISPISFFSTIKDAMVTAFATRSSAGTLPVTMEVARKDLKVNEELLSFSLPLGATINMDGVCVHLPMFAILAVELFGLSLTPAQILVMVLTTVLASIGAGGVPGGSLMLLFIILGPLGLTTNQIAIIVALALAINPITDMFETMNNVTGDLTCTNIVARTENMFHR
jgi:Na+/H+-dicarboxylate symporters